LMNGETLEAIFVQREALAKDLVDRIRTSTFTPAKHHNLVIGPRGMGKTHLVSLVSHRLRAMPDLQERLVIAWLREEEWGVTRFLDLLLRILRVLAEADATIEPKMEKLFELELEEAEAAAVNLLNQIIGERTLLLIAENLDDLFSGLGESGQQHLRAFLQTYTNCTILATSPRLFSGVQLRSAPFYGFFRPVHLNELSAAEAQQLLVNIATWRQQDDLVKFLETPDGQMRVKAVQHLAGGNPRIYIIFADFLTRQSLDELVSPFMSLVDALTPYYQSRIAYLSPQQRAIVELLCEKKHPLAVKYIAQRCFISQATVSGQLKKLGQLGYVKAESIGRESFYDMAEPLMRICLGVKKERGEPLRLMVDFLRVWYPKTELQTMHQELLMASERSEMMCRYLEQALDDLQVNDPDPRIQACINEIQAKLGEENYEAALKVAEKLLKISDFWLARVMYASCLAFLEDYEEALEIYNKVIEIKSDDYWIWYIHGMISAHLNRHEEALESYNKAIEIKPDDYRAWCDRERTLSCLSRYQITLDSYDKVIELDPEDELGKISHTRTLAALNPWSENKKALAKLLKNAEPIHLYILEKIVLSLFKTVIEPHQWPPQIEYLITQLESYERCRELGAALVIMSRDLLSDWVSQAQATAWCNAWVEVAGRKPEFVLPLRLLSTALRYKQTPDDPRVFFELASEEQKILRQALGLGKE
jgi:tetratricopeptide (TPR) repeat protein